MEHETDGNERKPLQAKPSRHSTIMRGIVTPIFGLLAVTCIVLGIMNATVWKPSPHVDARGRVDSTYLVTDPGVLSLVNKRVTARAAVETPGASSTGSRSGRVPICMALTTAQDAKGWTSGQEVSRVSGLESWQSLRVAEAKTSGKTNHEKNGTVPFEKSDMWQQVECGDSSVSMDVKVENPNQVILIQRGGTQDADATGGRKIGISIEMLWERDQLPDFSMPFYFGGALLAILALLSATVFAMDPSRRRKKNANREESNQENTQVSVAQVLGSILLPGLGRRGARHGADRHGRPARDHSESGSDHGRIKSSANSSSIKETGQPKVIDLQTRNVLAEPEVDKYWSGPDTGTGMSESQGSYSNHPVSGHMTYAGAGGGGDSAQTVPEGVEAGSVPPGQQRDEHHEGVDGQSELNSRDNDQSETSVISIDDMQAYLARFADEEEDQQEEGGEGAKR